jgi:predicted nucleotidyltransferase
MHIINKENIPKVKEIDFFFENFDSIDHHKQIIEKALKFSKNIAEVEAIFIMGSIALEKADIFSDIDFFVMINENRVFDDIKNDYLSNLSNFGEVIHIFQSNAYSKNSIIYFKPYIKFDLVIEEYDKLVKDWRLGKRGKILFDRNGLGQKALNNSRETSFNIDKHMLEIKNVAIELPSFCYNIAGYMIRGEIITSIDFIAWIRRLLIRISGFLLDIQDEGTRRAEKRFPKDIIFFYHQIKIKEINDIWNCLEIILNWFSDWMVPHFNRLNIEHVNDEIPIIKYMISNLKKEYKVREKKKKKE